MGAENDKRQRLGGTYRAFGLPSLDRLEEIEFRFADGRAARGFRYGNLEMGYLMPPGNVMLLRFRCEAGDFVNVNVVGQNLAIVYEYLKAHRIGWVAEAGSWDFDDLKATVVHSIDVRDAGTSADHVP